MTDPVKTHSEKDLHNEEMAQELLSFIENSIGQCSDEILDRLKEKLIFYTEI